jgi:TRAP-type C4-dicarboxylate transport system permease small subunit
MNGEKKNVFARFFHLIDLLLTFMVVLILAEVLLEVFFRYLLHRPLSWGGELSQTILVWITFIGAAAALFRGEHMTIDLLLHRITSGAAKKILRTAALLLVILFLLVGIRAGGTVVGRTWNMRTTAMQIPAGILYLAFPAGCLLMLPVAVRDLRKALGKGDSSC